MSMYPDKAGYDRQAVLTGNAVDALNWLVWAKTKDGSKNRNRPKSVLPGKDTTRRTGTAPKPTRLSRLKELFKDRVTARDDQSRDAVINKLFG